MNQDLMELLEWLDLKYEAYLCRVNMFKHNEIQLGQKGDSDEEAVKLIQSDHEMMIDLMEKKIEQLSKIEEILERVENRSGPQRVEIEKDVKEIQNDLQKLNYGKVISEIKGI